MHVIEINIPFRVPGDHQRWITVPPQGYGGIQSALACLIDGLIELGHHVSLLGAPDSVRSSGNLNVVQAAAFDDMMRWVKSAEFNLLHDHSCACHMDYPLDVHDRVWRVYHLSRPPDPEFSAFRNIITLSEAHRHNTGLLQSQVIRLPVNPKRFDFARQKKSYLLFLGRVSQWKGVREAASFAACAGMKLVVAGPCWEQQYFAELINDYGSVVEYVGELGGERKRRLLAEAFATVILSKSVPDQTGYTFCEPGSTVVSESAVSGTPVIGSSNGCLSEIVPRVGTIVQDPSAITPQVAKRILDSLPAPAAVREAAIEAWSHTKIASEYLNLAHKKVA
jgi:glycosyltransferase involved in cell wall biosynthesis